MMPRQQGRCSEAPQQIKDQTSHHRAMPPPHHHGSDVDATNTTAALPSPSVERTNNCRRQEKTSHVATLPTACDITSTTTLPRRCRAHSPAQPLVIWAGCCAGHLGEMMCSRDVCEELWPCTSASRYMYCHCLSASLYMSAFTSAVPPGPRM